MTKRQWFLRSFELLVLAALTAIGKPYVERLVEHTIATHGKVDRVDQRVDTLQTSVKAIELTGDSLRETVTLIAKSQRQLMRAQKHTDSAIGRLSTKLDIAAGATVLTHAKQ